MNLFGWEIRRKALSPPQSGRWITINDPFTGAWQQGESIEIDTALTFSAVFACLRLITSDIGKMGMLLKEQQDTGIWAETTRPQFSPVLRKPNSIQTRIKFFEQWLTSKLLHGNAYILKGRDRKGLVTGMKVLDPTLVQVLVSDSGEAFYRLMRDRMTVGLTEITLPATEIIHDVHVTPDHPLVGVSPIVASGLAALQGLKIQNNSEKFFANRALPSGMLSAPGTINDATALRLKTDFHTNYGGDNIGKVLVAGDGLEFKQFTMTAVDAQLIEQLKWTAEDVCRAFGVPPYKIGVGAPPAHNNINALDQSYYSQTLQELIECIELLLDEGLELPSNLRTEFDLDGLLRMDSMTQATVMGERIKAGVLAPNEGRKKLGLGPVVGGNTPYLQQQNYSLSALKFRDMKSQEDSTDVQASAMNGGQVTSLQGLLAAVANGEMPPETAASAIAAAFPLLTPTQISDMIDPLANFNPPSEPEPEDMPEVVEEGMRAMLRKELADVQYAA